MNALRRGHTHHNSNVAFTHSQATHCLERGLQSGLCFFLLSQEVIINLLKVCVTQQTRTGKTQRHYYGTHTNASAVGDEHI